MKIYRIAGNIKDFIDNTMAIKYIKDNIIPELQELAIKVLNTRTKSTGYYVQGRWERTSTPQQDSARSRAGQALYKAYMNLYPTDIHSIGYIKIQEILQTAEDLIIRK